MKYSPDLYFDLTEQRKVSEFYPVDHNPPRCKLLHEVCSCARARPVRQSRAWGLCSCIQASQHSSTLSNGFSNGWMCGNTSLCEAEIHGAMVLLWFRWLFFWPQQKNKFRRGWSRDKQDLDHWNFIQRCSCPWSQNWFWIFFLCAMYAWGLCPFLGIEIYSEKNLAPKKFIRDKSGDNSL